MNIIIVDNEYTVLRSLEILIKPKVDRLDCFTDPNAALLHIKEFGHSVDILFADYFMPEMNGLELIRKSAPYLKPETLKVIISGHVDLIPLLSDKRYPIDLLLSKPFDLDRLLSLLNLPRNRCGNPNHSQTKRR